MSDIKISVNFQSGISVNRLSNNPVLSKKTKIYYSLQCRKPNDSGSFYLCYSIRGAYYSSRGRLSELRLQAVPFWIVERVRETGARKNKREETGAEAFFPPLPKPPSARSLQFFRTRLFRATSRLSRKGLLAV